MDVSSTGSEVVATVLAGLDADAATPVLEKLDESLPGKKSELPREAETNKDIKKIGQVLAAEEQRIPPGEFLEILRDSLRSGQDYLKGVREEHLRQARLTFNAALALVVAGVLIVLVGIVLAYASALSFGLVTAAVGATSDILGGVLFKFHKAANDRLDKNIKDIMLIEKALLGLDITSRIPDSSVKKETTKSLVEML